jgi:hypothetical protein
MFIGLTLILKNFLVPIPCRIAVVRDVTSSRRVLVDYLDRLDSMGCPCFVPRRVFSSLNRRCCCSCCLRCNNTLHYTLRQLRSSQTSTWNYLTVIKVPRVSYDKHESSRSFGSEFVNVTCEWQLAAKNDADRKPSARQLRLVKSQNG